MLTHQLLEASRGGLRFEAPLSAIAAVVVGLIASLAVFFAGLVLWPAGSFNPWALQVVAARCSCICVCAGAFSR